VVVTTAVTVTTCLLVVGGSREGRPLGGGVGRVHGRAERRLPVDNVCVGDGRREGGRWLLVCVCGYLGRQCWLVQGACRRWSGKG